jgi:hypothetical protein
MVYDPKRFKENQARRLAIGKGQIQKPNRTKGSAAFTCALLMPDSVKECITKTRLELFGSQEPPFSDIEKMGEWLVEEHKTQPPAEGHAPEFGYRLEKNTPSEKIKDNECNTPRHLWFSICNLTLSNKRRLDFPCHSIRRHTLAEALACRSIYSK